VDGWLVGPVDNPRVVTTAELAALRTQPHRSLAGGGSTDPLAAVGHSPAKGA
jgi:hypothetical protein